MWAKDFRPISISSVQLKTLERIIDSNIKQRLFNTTWRVIESYHEFKQYTMAAFLDLQVAIQQFLISKCLVSILILRIVTNSVKSEKVGVAYHKMVFSLHYFGLSSRFELKLTKTLVFSDSLKIINGKFHIYRNIFFFFKLLINL